ncbi:SPOR domain-containing protein [Flavobacterium jejuense]|uniref:SPOR domain-containing protein n=1 Tax=Flavobacterium jejuense TaxID=1544455 RepID=A0ABX0IXD4_9FLAO|nr:SPOR domain-containing protein [Flavobacterium jejuense]NHN27910.1 SPOR domain-containing protein [Flavobacterium jejuense]
MPYIEEKDLVALHQEIEKNNRELKEFTNNLKKERKKGDVFKGQRNIFIIVSGIVLLVLFSIVVVYYTKPLLLINNTFLNEKGIGLYDSGKIDTLEKKILEYKKINEELLNSNSLMKENSKSSSAQVDIVYTVQIGAFYDQRISLHSEVFGNFKELQEDEFYKYSLGNFDNLNEAQIFRKKLLTIGFEDAFIVSYKEGKRLKIEEVN